jgi:hypothetical protein
MMIIPVQAVPSQTLSAVLANQSCQIAIYQKPVGDTGATMFVDLLVNNAPIMTGVVARDRLRLVREPYLGFVGDLAFVDTQGASDPLYTGLGSRFQFLYVEPADLNN